MWHIRLWQVQCDSIIVRVRLSAFYWISVIVAVSNDKSYLRPRGPGLPRSCLQPVMVLIIWQSLVLPIGTECFSPVFIEEKQKVHADFFTLCCTMEMQQFVFLTPCHLSKGQGLVWIFSNVIWVWDTALPRRRLLSLRPPGNGRHANTSFRLYLFICHTDRDKSWSLAAESQRSRQRLDLPSSEIGRLF